MPNDMPNAFAQWQQRLAARGLVAGQSRTGESGRSAPLYRPLRLPQGMSELQVRRTLRGMESQAGELPLFRGAGAYRHAIPQAVETVASRWAVDVACNHSLTEENQGLLQALWEYQALLCRLTGMDRAALGASDGAAACAQAMLCLRAVTGKSKILVSAGLHPEYRRVLDSSARFAGIELRTLPLNKNGITDMGHLMASAQGAAGAILQSPNFFGCVEALGPAAEILHESKALLAACVNPLSLGLLHRPGDVAADLCVGEGQPLGIPLRLGGPYLGLVTAKQAYGDHLPGWRVIQKPDHQGFALVQPGKEREGLHPAAVQNVLANSLCALRAAAYLAIMGGQGLRDVAWQSMQKAHYLKDGILSIPGMGLRYPHAPFFHEFVVEGPKDPAVINAALRAKGYVGGLRIARYIPQDRGILYCATEMNTREEIDGLLNALEEVCCK